MEQMLKKRVAELLFEKVEDHQTQMYNQRNKMRLSLCELVRHLQGSDEGYIKVYDEYNPIYVPTGINNDAEVLYGVRVRVEKDDDHEHLSLYLYTDGSSINQMSDDWSGWFYEGAYYDGNYGDIIDAVDHYIRNYYLM